jgi:hypothetical protein
MGKQRAVAARYIQRSGTIAVALDSGLELRFRSELVPELRHASHHDLKAIQITPSGQGLHWAALDADLYIPGILNGRFGPARSHK